MKLTSMKKYILFIGVIISVFIMSIVCTLALVTDSNNKISDTTNFSKIALCEDNIERGSVLSINLDNYVVGNGEYLISNSIGNPLLIRPTEDTADCYIRFSIYFTLNDEKLDKENKEILDILNNQSDIDKGLTLYEDLEYKYEFYDGYYYLIVADDINNEILKVATNEDNENGFVITKDYILYFDETKINEILQLTDKHSIYLKVQAEAIQSKNLSNIVTELEDNGIIDASNASIENKENFYGNVTIKHYSKAMIENIYTQELEVSKVYEYQELEYIKSNGTHYIDTGVYGTNNTEFEIDFKLHNYGEGSYGTIIGAKSYKGSNTNSENQTNLFGFVGYSVESSFRFSRFKSFSETNRTLSYKPITLGQRYICKYKDDNFFVNNEYYTTLNETKFKTDVTLTLFANNEKYLDKSTYGITMHCKVTLYSLKIWEGGELVRDFIPVLHENVAKLYDKVEDKMYSASSGSFEYKEKEIENTTIYNHKVDSIELEKGFYKLNVENKCYGIHLKETLYKTDEIIVRKFKNEVEIYVKNNIGIYKVDAFEIV